MAERKKSRMGRPPMKATDRRDVLITVRFKRSEYKQLAADAKAAGRTVADYLRQCWLGRRV